jgi:hypothetical protein
MAGLTYYVAFLFCRDDEGLVVVRKSREARSSEQALDFASARAASDNKRANEPPAQGAVIGRLLKMLATLLFARLQLQLATVRARWSKR